MRPKLSDFVVIPEDNGFGDRIISVEHRSNNPKRDYLFVNRWQGKHIPTSPNDFGRLVERLGTVIVGTIGESKARHTLVVGFAETATALAQYLFNEIGALYYLQTTRENIEADVKIHFEEEHSHAVNQEICIKNIETLNKLIESNEIKYVLFVDDEITTGNTVINLKTVMYKKLGLQGIPCGVASICNWQTNYYMALAKKSGIEDFMCLIKGEIVDKDYKLNIELESDATKYIDASNRENSRFKIKVTDLKTDYFDIFTEERAGHSENYTMLANVIGEAVIERAMSSIFNLENTKCKQVTSLLVIGTEEFMTIPYIIAERIQEELGIETVKFQATTRSCIDIIKGSKDKDKEISMRGELSSAYDQERKTYIYNLDKYDAVIVVTDSKDANIDKFIQDIGYILVNTGNTEDSIFVYKV